MGWGRPAPLRCELNLLGRPCGAGWLNKEECKSHEEGSCQCSMLISVTQDNTTIASKFKTFFDKRTASRKIKDIKATSESLEDDNRKDHLNKGNLLPKRGRGVLCGWWSSLSVSLFRVRAYVRVRACVRAWKRASARAFVCVCVDLLAHNDPKRLEVQLAVLAAEGCKARP